jgi:hypothetical protein
MKHRIVLAIALTLLAAGASGQQNGSSPRRAPLANVEDLEPSVDVSQPRVALAQPPAQPAVTQPAPPAAPTVPQTAVPAPAPARSTADRPVPGVMDSLDLGTTSITGNAELPKVLYIVPWKKSDLGDLVLAPVDPAVFERHLSYYDSLHGTREQE